MNDIANIKPNERIIEIRHPATDEPLGIRLTIIPNSDPRVKKIIRQITDKSLALRRKNKQFTAEEIEQHQTELLLASVTGWDWGENSFKGEKPAFTSAKLREVLTELEWLRQQLDEELGDTKSFF